MGMLLQRYRSGFLGEKCCLRRYSELRWLGNQKSAKPKLASGWKQGFVAAFLLRSDFPTHEELFPITVCLFRYAKRASQTS